MTTKYTYSINGDFPNQKIAHDRLIKEIQDSSIITALAHINTDSDVCDVHFNTSLSGSEETTLSGVVSAHSGNFLYSKYEVGAGEDLGLNKAVYISSADEGKLSKADSESTVPCIGFTTSAVSSGSKVTIQTNDVLGRFSGLTPAAEYYLSQTVAGELTTTKPSTGIIIRVGVAKNSSEMDVHILRLEPSSGGGGGVYGSEYQVVESDPLSSITGTIALQEKLRLDVTDLPLGKYRVSWNFDWLYSNTNNSFQAQIEIDDGFTFIHMMTQEPQDASNEYNESGFNILTSFSGTHHFDLDYRTLNASHTAKILNARLEIWRVE